MKLVYQGKTKDVYAIGDGNYLLKFKDDVTGVNGVFDPGANQVGLTMPGAGKAALKLTRHFFELLKDKQVPTHYLGADLEALTMTVAAATPFGEGLEVICRYRAVGSFFRRYGRYIKEGASLDGLIEFTLKDDARQDPPINEEALIQLGLLEPREVEEVKAYTRQICNLVKEVLAGKGLELYDIKLEFGRLADKHIALIDEISFGNFRAYKDGVFLEPLDLERLLLDEAVD